MDFFVVKDRVVNFATAQQGVCDFYPPLSLLGDLWNPGDIT